jgi:membrane protein
MRTRSDEPGRASTRRSWLRQLRTSLPLAVANYGRDRCAQHAAAISYRVLFSIIPLFVFVVSILALVLDDASVRAELVDWLLRRFPLTPEAGADLERILRSVPTPASGAGLLSILALVWSGSGMMASVRIALTDAFERGYDRPFAQSKLVDIFLLLSASVLLISGFALSIAVHAAQRWSGRLAEWLNAVALDEWGILANVAPPLLAFPAFLLLYRFVPPAQPRIRDVWVGAMFAALGVGVINLGFAYYLGTVATWDLLYGSLGSILAFLLAVYLSAGSLLFGAEVAAASRRGADPADAGDGGSFGRRVGARVRGLFVTSRPRGHLGDRSSRVR